MSVKVPPRSIQNCQPEGPTGDPTEEETEDPTEDPTDDAAEDVEAVAEEDDEFADEFIFTYDTKTNRRRRRALARWSRTRGLFDDSRILRCARPSHRTAHNTGE